MSLQQRIETVIAAATGAAAQIDSSRAVGGGCIANARIVRLTDGRELFIKSGEHLRGCPRMFEAEFRALELLARADAVRVPTAIGWDEDFLVLECFHTTSPAPDWQERMGRALARLHLATKTTRFGFERDNYLGATPQPNGWRESWSEFWGGQRLDWQLRLFAAKTVADDPLLAQGRRLLSRLDDLLGDISEPAVLLHGDLWSGNAAAVEDGGPIIFDPASYYGHREAEFGMMRMFGGFDARCEAAYQELWPFLPGAEERICLYRLYHELNHLNLFGAGYYQRCISSMRQLL